VTGTELAIKYTHKNHAAKDSARAKNMTPSSEPVESAAWKQLQDVKCHFVVKTYCTFVDQQNICVVMELCSGGDLNVHLEMCGSFNASDSKFYAAEICLGLAALHGQNIIYHDLKPQNMMLSKSGHIRLIDFGLASVKTAGVRNCCHCMCGAPSYMSPEMCDGKAHDEMTDWWAVGITYYEMLTGCRPFGGSSLKEISNNAKTCSVNWDGTNVARETRDMVEAFLVVNPANRLGGRGGIDAIRKHANFQSSGGFKWDDIKNVKRPGPQRDKNGKMRGTGGANMTRMDSAMLAAGGGKPGKKGERRFTITEAGKPSSTATLDESKRDTVAGKSHADLFAAARERAEDRSAAKKHERRSSADAPTPSSLSKSPGMKGKSAGGKTTRASPFGKH